MPKQNLQRPSVRIIEREFHQAVYDYLLEQGVSPFIAKIVARRIKEPKHALQAVQLKLKQLTPPQLMLGMDKAAKRLISALHNQEVIGLETDHDCDGQTSHAILYEGLVHLFNHPKEKIRSYIGHRMKEGYGLSEALAKRILSDTIKPTLIITADNGSTDEDRIALLKSNGIDTIVTDHHAIPPQGVPKSAYAVLNPTQSSCQFNDPYIAGCMVAWLLVAEVRRQLLQQGKLVKSEYQLTDLLDFVAVGTVADCVSMSKSLNNRIVAHYGMQKITEAKRQCWQSFSEYFHQVVNSEFLGFVIGPLLNSDGRMADALSSVSFLLSQNAQETYQWVEFLQQQNQNRKAIQKEMTHKAMLKAHKQYNKGQTSICVYLPDGHAGVHGISASRIKDAFGLPTILFSPKLQEDEVITGSARSIDGLNLKTVLDQVAANSSTIVKYGGHSGAAGLSIYKEKFTEFCVTFEYYVAQALQADPSVVTGPVLYTEGRLSESDLNLSAVEKLSLLEPYGREFEAPIFYNQAKICALRFVGKTQEHLQLQVNIYAKTIKAIWFFACEHKIAQCLKIGDDVNIAYRLSKESYQGRNYLSMKVEYVEKA